MFDAEIMSLIMDCIYHDWSFRLRYRVTSKTNNQAFISDKRLVREMTYVHRPGRIGGIS